MRKAITEAEFDAHDGYCRACYKETWFRCTECQDSIERSDAHPTRKSLDAPKR